MAEQVVDIRERIERMRTQIDIVPSSGKEFSENDEEKVKSVSSEQLVAPKKNLTDEKKLKIQEPKVKENKIIKQEVKKNFENVKLLEENVNTKQNKQPNNFSNNEDNSYKKESVSEGTYKDLSAVNQKTESSKKTYQNYEYNNTFDSANKKIEEDNLTQKFPQFSLKIKDPNPSTYRWQRDCAPLSIILPPAKPYVAKLAKRAAHTPAALSSIATT